MSALFLRDFAAWAAKPNNLTAGAHHQARLSLIDTLACMHAGKDEPQTLKAIASMQAAGAIGPVKTVITNDGFCAPAAALILGTAAHALDYDDYEVPGSTHPSAPILGALLPLAVQHQKPLRDLLVAYLVGYEMIVRFGEALGYGHYMRGWHATATLGPLGAAAAAAKFLRLDAHGIEAAIGLSLSTSAGLKAQFGSDAKALHAGLAARAGLDCALLAQAGATVGKDLLSGPYGFLALYGAEESPGFAGPNAALGKTSAMENYPVLRKPWPSCAYTHRAIEAAIGLAKAPAFDPAAIKAITIRTPEPYFRVSHFLDPQDGNQARFSLTYCVAVALLSGAVTPAAFSATSLTAKEPRKLMEKIQLDLYDLAPGLGDMSPQAPDTVRVTLQDGTCLSKTVAAVKGGPDQPMSEEDIIEKFLTSGGTTKVAERILKGPDDKPLSMRNEQ